jgi:XTP/dITP diphosphohydrolase
MKILVATRNQHKLDEIRDMLAFPGLELVSVDDFADLPEVDEDGDTFEANAAKKAVTLARASGCWSLADDSGLEVDALEGAPGIYSARYAGVDGDDDANNRKLLEAMTGVTNRQARFRCALVLSSPEGVTQSVDGACEGLILHALVGEGGFGYDGLFAPIGHDRSFGEFSADEKNQISHRRIALDAARREWGEFLSAES